MNSYSLVPFVTLIVYVVLLAVILRDVRTRVRRLFFVYVLGAMGWSLSSFLIYSNFFPDLLRVWGVLLPVTGLWAVVAYYHFVCAFVKQPGGLWLRLGYLFLSGLTVLAALGYVPRHLAYLGDGFLEIEYGPWLYLMSAGGAVFAGLSIAKLVSRYWSTRDPLNRNRVAYLLIGMFMMVLFCSQIAIVGPVLRFPLDHIGHLLNALVITYAIFRYQLFDIKLVVRKGLAYSLITVCVTALYLLFLYSLHYFFQEWAPSTGLGAMIAVTLLMAWLFNPLRTRAQRLVDRLFYGERYDYRETVLSFARNMSNVLDLNQLAEDMLKPISRAVRAAQASLLLSNGDFYASQFAERLSEGEAVLPVKLKKASPIVSWLSREDRPLTREMVDLIPEFKALWEEERNALESQEVEMLCPIKSKGTLIGVLALGKKQGGGLYSNDDMDLLMTLATEAAVAIENAQLYDQAKQRAHTDELTGLYNHRYFHERLDEEITRCTRFGEIFSLVFLDLDLFKAYNDIYGHVAGDDVLRDIGGYIQSSIRGIDMAFRYGGDEFTVILPQASLDDARKIAERMRRKIEVEMDGRGAPLSCSIGVASWPTDGVMREEIVRGADTALYHAKQTGRDRVCLYSEVAPVEEMIGGLRPDGEPGILSTIYALAATVDAKDSYTYGHSKKVAKYATDIAEALGYSSERIATLRAAALLHDIGKIGVSDELLVKAGPLTAEDWEPIRSHPKLGVAIIKHVESLGGCLAAIQYHHERYDGTGYPAGLKGENIPLDARILAVADSYDAMTSLRPYREGKMTHEEAAAELRRCAGTQFDLKIVDAFVSIFDKQGVKSSKITKGKRSQALAHNEVR
jgi:diguanylate cyclase (GGDEF)-like protein/putative nucleotidyltransferase with HDIG domain